MEKLDKKYIFNKNNYEIQKRQNKSILISNRLFKVLFLNDTGERIIDELDGSHTVQDIIDILSSEYDLEETVISESVQEYVEKLLEQSLIKDMDDEAILETEPNIGIERIYCEIRDEKTEISTENLGNILNGLQNSERQCVIFIKGKEPFLHTGIREILELIGKNKDRIIIYTDGTILREELKEVIQKYAAAIMLNIAHVDKAANDRIMGNGHFEHYKTAVEFYQACGIPVYMNIRPVKENMEALVSLQQLAYDYKMQGVYIENPLISVNGEKQSKASSAFEEEYEKVKKELTKVNSFLNSWKNNRIKDLDSAFFLIFDEDRCFNNFRNIKYKPHCGIALNEVSIDAEGHLYPCHLLHKEEFKINNVEEYFLIKNNFNKDEITNRKCQECTYWLLCLGGCRAETYLNTGRLDQLSDSCKKKKDSIQLRLNKMAEI